MALRIAFTTFIFLFALSCGSDRFEAQMSSVTLQKSPIVIGDPDEDHKPEFCFPGTSAENPACPTLISATDAVKDSVAFQYANPYTARDFPKGFDRAQYLQPYQFLNIPASGESLAITPHFVLGEFLSASKGRYGLLSRSVLDRIQAMRTEINRPMRITSGYRSPGYNSGISGAAKWSRHTYGDAIDFSVSGMNFQQLRNLCLKHGANFFQIYSGHIHCDWRNTPLDPELFPVSHPNPSFVHTAAVMSQAIDLHSFEVSKGEWQLDYSGLEAEDGDTIEVNWVITSPSGKSVERDGPTVLFSPTETGIHQIHVNIGGSVEAQKSVHMEQSN